MGKFFSAISLLFLLLGCVFLPSCGGGNPTAVAPPVVPTAVTISPSSAISLVPGQTQVFTGAPVPNTFTFQSSDTRIVTIASNGQACAGTWNSLTAPQVCTPGPTGTAQITVSAVGVTSPPVTIYVHEPITNITISKVAGQPSTISNQCLSKGTIHGPESWLLQANAFNGSNDITDSVGPFTFQQINPGSANIVTLSALPAGTQGCASSQGQCLNQQVVTATTPGVGQVFASTGGFSSQPISIETCRVKSISIAAEGNVPTNTSFVVNTNTSTTLNATVKDAADQTITGVPLTWSAGSPISVGVAGNNSGAVFGSVGTASSPAVGAGTVIASCTPPACNAGIKPSLPIYPQAAFSFQVENGSTTPAATPTVYATTTACTDPAANPTGATCNPTLVPITANSATASFAASTPIVLPASPNSLIFDNSPASAKAYLGVDSSNFGQQGLMVFDGTTVTRLNNNAGKVLAISPDQSSVITSDTVDSPKQFFICSSCSAASRTVTAFTVPAGGTGPTAAAFSPDSLKAYILAGNTLYVYSKVDPLQTIPLGGTANDVAFHPEGGFAFLAGQSGSLTPYRVCDNAQISGTLSAANAPAMIRALPDGSSLLVLDPPNVDIINVTSLTSTLCTGAITDTISSFNFGEGSFVPTQFIVAPDGQKAYILGETQAGPPPSRLALIIVFNLTTQTPAVLSLSGGAIPLSAALSPTGNLLFVGANDGAVHVIDTSSGLDTQQVTFPFPTNELCLGPGNPATQVPLSQVGVSAAAQNGSSTTYSYSLTSGPPLKVNQSITISKMSDGVNNGTFTISSLGTDASGNPAFTVTNAQGANASGQSGVGVVPISCNPDLIAVKP